MSEPDEALAPFHGLLTLRHVETSGVLDGVPAIRVQRVRRAGFKGMAPR